MTTNTNAALREFAEGRIHHLNRGQCPDIVAGHDSRDPDCPVCAALTTAAAVPAASRHSEYPPLPEPDATTVGLGAVWNRHSMRAYVDADRDMRAKAAPEDIRSILVRCREFIDTTKIPAYPAGADLADEIDALLAAQAAPAAQGDAEDAARWRDLAAAVVEASANGDGDTPFMKAFSDAIGDSEAPFTTEQFAAWVDAARKKGAKP